MKHIRKFNETKEIDRFKYSRGSADGGDVNMDDITIEYLKSLKKYKIEYSEEDSNVVYLMERGPKIGMKATKNKVIGLWRSKNRGRYYLSLWGSNWQDDLDGKHFRCDSLDELKEFITKVFQIR